VMSVCLSASISPELKHPIFTEFSVHVTYGHVTYGGVAIRYVLPVLCGLEPQRILKLTHSSSTTTGAESDIYDCLLTELRCFVE